MRSGTGAHADAAAAATIDVVLRRAFRILVDCSERALFRAALAQGAPLEREIRIGKIAGPRMDGLALGRHLDRLDRLHRRAQGVFLGAGGVHRLTQRSGRVNRRPARLIREADKMRIGEAVPERRQIGTLPVVQIEDLRAFVRFEFLDLPGRGGLLLLTLAVEHLQSRIGQFTNRRTIGGIRNHARRQNHQIHVDRDILADERVLHLKPRACRPGASPRQRPRLW